MTVATNDAAILGVGEVVNPEKGTSSLELHAEAARRAIADAGLQMSDIDGLIVGYSLTEPKMVLSAAVAEYIGLSVDYLDSAHVGGAAPFIGVANAAAAVRTGQASRILVIFGDNRKSGWGSMDAAIAAMIGEVGHPDYELPYGPLIPANLALITNRHMYEYGTTREQLAAIPIAQRHFAQLRPGSERVSELSLEDIMSSRPVATPLVAADCALVSDAAAAIVVGHLDDDRSTSARARVRIAGAGAHNDFYYPFQAETLTSFGFRAASKRAYEQAGFGPDEVDFAEIYDAFSIIVLVGLEDLGFCEKGSGGPFSASGAIDVGGRLPINTHGGLLSFSGNGAFHITEAVQQLRHEAPGFQVADAKRALVTGIGGMLAVHCTIMLERVSS
jgi:acetyl-CoA acetyltransferase